MMRGRWSAWIAYALAGLALTAVIAGSILLLVQPGTGRAVLIAAVIAYGLQLAAFGILLWLRESAQLFLAGWLGGMVLRFGALALCVFWAGRTGTIAREPLLLSLVGFVFLLLLLEPVFLRWDLRKT